MLFSDCFSFKRNNILNSIWRLHRVRPRRSRQFHSIVTIISFRVRSACHRWAAERTGLVSENRPLRSNILRLQCILEATYDICAIDPFHLALHECINELVDVDVASPDADKYLVPPLNLDVNTPLAESVYALGLSQEENLHLLPLWVPIQKVRQCRVNLITLFPDVDVLILLQMPDFLIQ